MKRILLVILTIIIANGAILADIEAVQSLARRIVPDIADKILFEKIQAPGDSFLISQRNGKVLVQGSSTQAMAVGLNQYLRKEMGTSVSWYSDMPVQTGKKIYLPKHPYGGKAAVDNRFFLNYCTFGYTMPWWNWAEWEHFIDWMALNGINLPLAMTGQEKAWYLTWKKMGLTDEEILGSFTGPAHLPWHWMNNVDHFQGPLSMVWLDRQEALQRQILQRERELGMKPVLAAFAGHAPVALKERYPQAKITLRDDWAGFPMSDRCYFLDPNDSLYLQVQKTYVAIQDSLFGSDHIYGIDPFNEQESPDWSEEFLHKASAGIYSTLRQADPKAIWLQMTWNFYNEAKDWTKPRMKAYLEGVEGDNLLLLDYFCDNAEIWRRNDSYFGKPFIWCYLGNFGGNTMMSGNLKEVDTKLTTALHHAGKNLVGIGGTLEGFDVNPVMHEYILQKAWQPDLSAEAWTELWANSRGGNVSPEVKKAWQLLVDSIYVQRCYVGEASLTNARPGMEKPTGHYTADRHKYNQQPLLKALDLLLNAKGVTENAAYQYDVMNVCRQLLANEFQPLRDSFREAYEDGDLEKARKISGEMDTLLLDLDELLSTNDNFSMARWIADARSCASSRQEADAFEQNARTLLTTWSPPNLVLNDYGNRQWSGLMGSYYRNRWKQFTDAVLQAMEAGEAFDQDAFVASIKQWEWEWTKQHDKLTPHNPLPSSVVARRLRTKYFK